MGNIKLVLNIDRVDLIVAGCVAVIAVLCLIWMIVWMIRTKKQNSALMSIDSKLAPQKCAYAVPAAGTDEKDSSENMKQVSSPVPEQSENEEEPDKAEDETKLEEYITENAEQENVEPENVEPEKDDIQKEESEDETVRFGRELSEEIRMIAEAAARDTETAAETEKTIEAVIEKSQNDTEEDDDDECPVDVLEEIRKMLIETEKNPQTGKTIDDYRINTGRSGKKYSREELDKVIKF